MKTFKFLSLSLLVATIGVCGFGNTVAASSIIQNSSINDAIKLKEKYDAFYKELTKQVVDKENLGEVKKNLREISEESNVPFDVLKSILLTNPTYKQIDDVYQRMQPQNRTYSAVTKKMIEQTNEELYYGRVEYYFKVLGYNTTDVSNEEIVEYINQPGYTVTDAVEHFKKFGKSANEIREIYVNSSIERQLVYKSARELRKRYKLDDVNNIIDSATKFVQQRSGKIVSKEDVKEICKKLGFLPIMLDN